MAEISIAPPVDVMLVPLVIFIVTAPLPTHSAKAELPRASSLPHIAVPESVEPAIRGGGSIYWNGEPVSSGRIEERFRAEAQRPEPAEPHLRADRAAGFERVAKAISGAKRAGLTRIAFMTDPGEGGREADLGRNRP
jgi:biopolymer transport protein ExbD